MFLHISTGNRSSSQVSILLVSWFWGVVTCSLAFIVPFLFAIVPVSFLFFPKRRTNCRLDKKEERKKRQYTQRARARLQFVPSVQWRGVEQWGGWNRKRKEEERRLRYTGQSRRKKEAEEASSQFSVCSQQRCQPICVLSCFHRCVFAPWFSQLPSTSMSAKEDQVFRFLLFLSIYSLGWRFLCAFFSACFLFLFFLFVFCFVLFFTPGFSFSHLALFFCAAAFAVEPGMRVCRDFLELDFLITTLSCCPAPAWFVVFLICHPALRAPSSSSASSSFCHHFLCIVSLLLAFFRVACTSASRLRLFSCSCSWTCLCSWARIFWIRAWKRLCCVSCES